LPPLFGFVVEESLPKLATCQAENQLEDVHVERYLVAIVHMLIAISVITRCISYLS
jgi:hypothetical protein